MKTKKIIFIVLSIVIIALAIAVYTLFMKQIHFKPKATYSICIWGDTTAKVNLKYIMINGDSNVIIEEKNIPIVHQKTNHALQKWNIIAIKPTYFTSDQHLPFRISVSAKTNSKVYIAVFDNDKTPMFHEDSFLVFHLLMLRSAYDDHPDVAKKSLQEWIIKSTFLKGKSDSSKNAIIHSLWTTMQTVSKDSIAQYLQQIHYPMFAVIYPHQPSVDILK